MGIREKLKTQGMGKTIRSDLGRYAIYIVLVIMWIILAIVKPVFVSSGNILNVLRQVSIIGVVAIGMTFVIISAGIDLSVGAIVGLTAVCAATFAHPNTFPVIVPISIALAVGTLFGAFNGLIIAYGNIAPFVVTLGSMTIARGLALVISGGRPVVNISDTYNVIGGGYLFRIPIPVYIILVVAIIGLFLLHATRYGRHVYAVGGNELSAKLSGLNIKIIKVSVYMLIGFLSGLSGIILSSRVMSGAPVAGLGYELDAIAAVVIGGTSLVGGIGSVSGTIIGILIIGTMNNGLDLLNVSSYYQQIAKGLIIILAVLMDRRSKA